MLSLHKFQNFLNSLRTYYLPQVFCQDLTRDKLWEIMEKIMAAYDDEPETREN